MRVVHSVRLAVVGMLLVGAACSPAEPPDRAGRMPARSDTPAPTIPAGESSAAPSATGSATASATASPAEPPHPVSLQALMAKDYDGRGLRIASTLARTSAYTRYSIRYKSGKLTISGIMNVPRGRGPFPVLILNHGYIDPAIYTTGRGMMREQDYLARRDYVVIHIDYRNHAQSSNDPNSDVKLRLGYTEDVINAVLAVKGSKLAYLDRDRVGLVGRSMGGGVVYNALVVKPDLVDAAVVFAPVSSNTVDNFNRWIRRDPGRSGLAQRIVRRFGAPEDNPEFWRNASPVNFFDRVNDPLLIHHGTNDESCPIRWSRTTLRELKSLGKDAQMFTYQKEQHAFGPQWPKSMRRTVAFLDEHLA